MEITTPSVMARYAGYVYVLDGHCVYRRKDGTSGGYRFYCTVTAWNYGGREQAKGGNA